jgi:Tfp pilus assembly protein PilF
MLLRAIAFVYQQQENFDQAEAAGRDAYRLMPDDVGLNNDLGYTLTEMGKNLTEAERMIRFAAGGSPDEAAYLDSLGWVFYKQGRFEEARKWLLRAAALEDGQDPVIYDHLGDAQWRLGDHDRAIQSWRRSLDLHDRKLLTGEGESDDKPAARTRQKLAAVGGNQRPEVAPIAPATQTAPQGG